MRGRMGLVVVPLEKGARAGAALVLLGVCLVLSVAGAPPAHACTCATPSEAELDARTPTVIIGMVLSETRHENRYVLPDGREVFGPGDAEYVVAVEAIEKGSVQDPMTLSTSDSRACCGTSFIVGDRYKFYLPAGDRSFSTGLCSGS